MEMIKRSKLVNIPPIDLGEIFLRAIEYDDYFDLYEYGSDERVTRTLSWTIDTLIAAETAIKVVHLSRPDHHIPLPYAIIHKETNKMIGTCDFHTIEWETLTGEIGYVMNHDFWGNGYMTKACKALIDFGFNYLGLEKIIISHELNNIGSQRVIEKSGFLFVEEKLHEKMKTRNKYYEIRRNDFKSIDKKVGNLT